MTFSGNVFYRNIRTEGINGNANTDSFDESVYQPSAADQAALTAAGYTGFPAAGANAANTPFPKWRCIAQALQSTNRREMRRRYCLLESRPEQLRSFGTDHMVFIAGSTRSSQNQFTAGGGFDGGCVDFTQNTQFGYINPDRPITGVNAWQDGSTNSNGMPLDSRVNLHGLTPDWSFFSTDTFRSAMPGL